MKKIILGTCLVIAIALLVSARWGTKAVNAPPADDLPPTDTTLAVALSLQDMVSQSDVIAIGNCVDVKSVWVGRTLVTLATVSVNESLKGNEASTITVELPGGVDANRKIPIAMSYPGAPNVAVGENVFLFLTATGEVAGSYNVTGFSQGKFSIVEEDGEQMVSRNLTKTSLQSNNGVRRGGADLMPLANMKEQVKGYLKNQ
jgi:hypothetical protein